MGHLQRTSGFVIFLRYLLVGLPIGIGGALLFGSLPFLIGFVIMLGVVWMIYYAVSHVALFLVSPDVWRQRNQNGGDSYLDEVGAPLNMDSEEVRHYGSEANAACPHCGTGMFLVQDQDVQCSNCNVLWTNNQFHFWNGSQWIPY